MLRELRTPRLRLLPVKPAYAAEMARVLGDPALHTFIGGAPESEQELRARYERWLAGSPDPQVTWCNWVVELVAQRRFVGAVQATVGPAPAHLQGYADDSRIAEIAWTVGTPWQGRGIAREAACALVVALAQEPLDAVIAHVHPDHHASASVAAAAGLTVTDVVHDGEVMWRLELSGPGAGA
ncbi:GNAT family N-acetyltransferase [Streptomyces sp. TRM66268-LWL]|uniref:GNAT family N-acetyltransferase n=1 Tax=Streptomyces polyasparticus TaxID=2767826 RepID=A0ABR7SVD0_9ACTN|nr:GNAT family N-acetyltransferase [Streptomyces polyasparticus]